MWRVRKAFDAIAHRVKSSLRYRLVLLTMAAIVVGTLLSSFFTYQAARVSMYSQLDRELTIIADQTAQQLAIDMTVNSIPSADSLQAENVVVMVVAANSNDRTLLGDPDNTLIVSSPEYAVARVQAGSSARDGERKDGTEFRIVAVPFITADTGDPWAVVLGRELAPTSASLQNIEALQWIISLVVIGLCGVATWFVARTVLEPINVLTSKVASMTESDELTPIEVHGDSEVADLERTFNSLIASLDNSRERQNRLIADASHELRTPLTSLRTNIELLIADEKSQMLPEGARAQILSDVATQLGEFTSLVGDMVALSRETPHVSNLVPVNLSDVVESAVDRAKRRGPNLIFNVTLKPQYVLGDAPMLERAVTNLLDNAVKFSPEGGTITVTLDENGLAISDQGPGISDSDMPHVFERFYRSDSSRNTPGTGLGLSIVAHTVTSHGGTVTVGRAPEGGAMFTVQLPEVEPPEE